MASHFRSPLGLAKRLKIAPPKPIQSRSVYQGRHPWHRDPVGGFLALEHQRDNARQTTEDFDEFMADAAKEARGVTLPAREPTYPLDIQRELNALRLPRSVQLNYMKPLKRTPIYGKPVADLQLRSYSIRNLEFFADFCLRAAYYLGLPAKGPVPLPRITERWTVPRSNFVHKKSQENFERITLRRLIQIQDGHPEVVQIWLGFIQKYQYHGVGMKANVWEYCGLDVAGHMDAEADKLKETLDKRLALFGRRQDLAGGRDVDALMNDEVFKAASGRMAPMGGMTSV